MNEIRVISVAVPPYIFDELRPLVAELALQLLYVS